MKLQKTSNGKEIIKISKSEWQSIGKNTGWLKVAGSEDKLEEGIIQFLKDNPNPSDEGKGGVHEWAQKNGYNKHKVEEFKVILRDFELEQIDIEYKELRSDNPEEIVKEAAPEAFARHATAEDMAKR